MNLQELKQVMDDLAIVEQRLVAEAMQYDWQHLAANGLKIMAIRKYRLVHQTGLLESKNAVEAFLDSL